MLACAHTPKRAAHNHRLRPIEHLMPKLKIPTPPLTRVVNAADAHLVAMQAEIDVVNARYRTLFNAIDEGYCVLEMIFDAQQQPVDYRFLEVNPAFERQTGLVHAAGKRILELAPVAPFWLALYGGVAHTGVAQRVTHEADLEA
jgi:PAS domain-containing protein